MKGEHDSGGILQVFARLLMLPMAVILSGVDVLIRTLQQIEDVSKQGMEVVAGRQGIPGPSDERAQTTDVNAISTDDVYNRMEITDKEETPLTTNGNCGTELDKDLHDDMLKLVRYKVLFVRREYEVAFPEKEDLVSDNMDGSAFTAWKIAEFIQDLQDPGKEKTPVPSKWRDKKYPEDFVKPEGDFAHGYLTGIPHEDKKYLRVYYEVLERYPREKFKYEEQQIRVLEDIRDELKKP